MSARERFSTWVNEVCGSQQLAADLLGNTQSAISKVMLGQRRPGLDLAVAIEKATIDWIDGPILAADWLAPSPVEPVKTGDVEPA